MGANRHDGTGGLSAAPGNTLAGVLSSLLSDGGASQPKPQSTGIPTAVLAGAPHLNQHASATPDPHVAETWRLRTLYTSEGAPGPLIDLAQQQILEVPLPRAIWKDILSDNYVNFEKLHAAMDPGYNYEDEAKDLAGGLAIVRKDHSSAKKPLRTEGDWGRVYDAWMDGVKFFFPHRAEELIGYKKIIRELFQLMPDPALPIQVDLGIRDSYSRNRFHLDDRNRHTIYISTQLSRTLLKVRNGLRLLNLITRPSTSQRVELLSKVSLERSRLEATIRAREALAGPRAFVSGPDSPRKRKLDVTGDLPKFRRGFGWAGISPPCISPAALHTEHAPPLPRPPEHLLRDVNISAALRACADKINTSPMFVMWRNDKPRVVTDHTASGLNDGIPRAEAKVRYDNMHDFAQVLRSARALHPDRRLIVFKSDVASAFLNLPAHPLWQLRQVVTVDGKFYIVPQLLILWDKIGCPWEPKKQLADVPLVIIGFWVDPNLGTISLSPASVDNLIEVIKSFLNSNKRKQPLREWQRLAGHLNWLLNVLPWGRPAL
ncbi:hypothetical protein CERSUDRAFT_60905, partial [Gelatoporia subvermispora B]